MTKLDLVILREMAETRRPSQGFEPKTVIALLDRIDELEREVSRHSGECCTILAGIDPWEEM